MDDKVIQTEMGDEFKTCPSCGYEDGFHNMFKKAETGDGPKDGVKGKPVTKWLFICPACHKVFDIGMTI